MARERDRTGVDNAGVGPDPTHAGRLRSIRDVRGLDIASGEPDIRGWEVRTIGGRRIGSVNDLLVDEDRREIVMIDVDLQDGNRHVEVPIRAAQLDRGRHCVIIDSADAEPIGDRFERRYRERMAGLTRDVEDRDRLDRDRIEADRLERDRLGRDRLERDRMKADRSSDVEEIVVEQRPVVMEETVVRRRPVGEEDLDRDITDPDRR